MPSLSFQLNNYLNSIEQFPEFQSDDVNKKIQNNILKITFASQNRELLMQ